MISASNWIKLTTNRILGMVRFCTVVWNSEIGTCVNAKPKIKMRKRLRIKIYVKYMINPKVNLVCIFW
jgi:hypothetical protein